MSTDPIVIKKYENRRLYDTRASRYVNLDGVAALVLEGADVQVVDATTGEDLTRQVLTQVIVERSRDPDPEAGLPVDFLRDLIRASDRAQKDFLRWYLSAAGEVYQQFRSALSRGATTPGTAELRRHWEEWVKTWLPGAAASPFAAVWGRSSEVAKGSSSNKDRGKPDRHGSSGEEGGESTHAPAISKDEVAELRQRLEELERRLEEQG